MIPTDSQDGFSILLRIQNLEWSTWFLVFAVSLLTAVISHSGILTTYLPTITLTPYNIQNGLRLTGLVIGPIAGLITIFTFFRRRNQPTEQFKSIQNELEDKPNQEDMAEMIDKFSQREDPLESMETLVTFLIPPEILGEMDTVYSQNRDQILEVADNLCPSPDDYMDYHHPAPLAFLIGTTVTGVIREAINEGVQGDVLSGATHYLTCVYFGVRAMEDANISINSDVHQMDESER
ncbi:hypothetical protein [Saliphagus infecundisoli]|uniref:Uncharacterized protein n=1 Tax=Saliphagus infecundisoli TaxID=1849069 RepID=A0ABD5QHP4_9EURY|nr:hypothetical protein [Saliphagus infecundisoli]